MGSISNRENETEYRESAQGSAEQTSYGWKGYLAYYAGYTGLFCLAAAAVFVWFYLTKRRFVWTTDGVNQHYYGLVYFSRWGKEVIRQFRETGIFRLPTFSLRMGYGEDLLTTLAYYVIGDPFSLPAVFVPERYMLAYHDIMLLVRFYLAGISFSAYNFCMGRKNRIGVLAGALVYVFNGFTLAGMRHHYFLNPFVFFPLLLIGCERYFRKKRPGLFIFMVFLTAVSNFYFFYMMVIMTVLYAAWRSFRLHGLRRLGRVILDGIAFVCYGLLGTLLSSVLFLPVILRFLQDPRTAYDKQIRLLWPAKYYMNFIDSFLTNGSRALGEYWTYMGFGAVAAFCVLFLFTQRKKHFDLKAGFVGLTALLLIPAAGYVLNGFSYPANRWMFAYALLIGTMTAAAVPEIGEAGGRSIAAAVTLTAALVAVCIGWNYTFSRETAQAVAILLFGLAAALLCRIAEKENAADSAGIASPGASSAASDSAAADPSASPDTFSLEKKGWTEISVRHKKYLLRVQALFLACVILTIVSAGYFGFAPSRSNGVYEYLSRAQIEVQTAKDGAAAAGLLDGRKMNIDGNIVETGTPGAAASQGIPFYRYTTFDPENNTSILYGVSNTQYYWSLSNPDVAQFQTETGMLNKMIHQYDTLDDRTALNEIAGVRYFLSDTATGVPFGYEKLEGLSYSNKDLWPENDSIKRYSCEVYENQYALPLGFTSANWISRDDYEAMDIPQRQQALLQGIVLEQDPGGDLHRLDLEDASVSSAGVQAAAQTADAAAVWNGQQLTFSDVRVPARIEYESDLIVDADKLPADTAAKSFQVEASEGGAHMTFRFSGLAGCETALYIRGLHYDPPAGRLGASQILMSVDGYTGETRQAARQIGYTTERNPWTAGRSDYLVNLRYHEEALDSIRLTLPGAGTYSFDSIEVVCQPMTDYPAQAAELGREVLTDLDIHEMRGSAATDKITGRISVSEPRILCLQIPPTSGWTAYVDGARTPLLQADTMFSALLIPEGTHDIELRYQTPGLRIGAVISAGTLLLLLLFTIVYTIISAVLSAGERRLAAIPEGEYMKAEEQMHKEYERETEDE